MLRNRSKVESARKWEFWSELWSLLVFMARIFRHNLGFYQDGEVIKPIVLYYQSLFERREASGKVSDLA